MIVASMHENSHKFHLYTTRSVSGVKGETTNVERIIHKTVVIKGRHHNKNYHLYSDPAFTENVEPQDWEAIQKMYSDHYLIKQGIIFAAETDAKTKDKAAKVISDVFEMPDPARPLKADKNGMLKKLKVKAE